MDINEIEGFKVKRTMEEPDETPRVLIENSQIKKQVEVIGKILEAQYRVGDDFLLFVTEGNPFEEALYIYFLDSNLQVKDSLEISAMYAEGILRNLSVVDSNRIIFSFFDNDEKWILEIFSSPKLTMFKNKYPIKRRMPIYQKSWLSLKKS